MFDNRNVATLNSLIVTTLHSVDGYRKAADGANGAQFRDMFLSPPDARVAPGLTQPRRPLANTPGRS
jgi:hypothetical protein